MLMVQPIRVRFVLDGVQRMRERPIQDLVDGLVQLGVDANCTMGTGCPPVAVNAQGLPSGKVSHMGRHQNWRQGRGAYVCYTRHTEGHSVLAFNS
jgi:5-enolpyruvylshikimate-3-phosphate synthase